MKVLVRVGFASLLGMLGALLVACSSSESGGGCSTDQDCKGDRVCESGECVDPGSVGAGGGSQASCIDQCVAATGDEPGCRQSCAGAGGAGGGTSTGGGPGSGGGQATGGGPGTGGSGGGMPGPTVVCPFDEAFAVGSKQEGPGADSFNAAFFSNGGLRQIDGVDCVVDSTMPGMVNGPTCFEVYTCGACTVTLNLGEGGDWTATGAGCPELEGFYGLCTPDCVGKVCGNDGCGGVCGTCSGGDSCSAGQCKDLCGDCISGCSGLGIPNCCTCGPGCICANECFATCPP